jgi:hypothetical protein
MAEITEKQQFWLAFLKLWKFQASVGWVSEAQPIAFP